MTVLNFKATDPCAVYRLYDAGDGLLYIGMSHEPDKRIRFHRYYKAWRSEISTWRVEWHANRPAAERAERAAIAAESPHHNIMSTPGHSAFCRAARASSRKRVHRRGNVDHPPVPLQDAGMKSEAERRLTRLGSRRALSLKRAEANMAELADEIACARRAGLTQERIAALTGLTRVTVAKYEPKGEEGRTDA